MKRTVALVLMLLAACHDRSPPTPSTEQNQQMDEAGNMLNEMAANAG